MKTKAYLKRYAQLLRIFYENRVFRYLKKFIKRGNFKEGFNLGSYEDNVSFAQSLRRSLEELGPTFVKFGQMLSTRSDIFPKEIIDELSGLQDNVKGFSFDQVQAIIEGESKKKLGDIFSYIEEDPLAQGSIAQVHRARLRSGEEVCIKVQRPHIKETIALDIKVLEDMAKKLSKRLKTNSVVSLEDLVEEFRKQIVLETDFSLESKALEKFSGYIRKDRYIKSPALYKDYVYEKFIVMAYVEGPSIGDLDQDYLDLHGQEIARRILHSYANQVFNYGYFHADPHPGNIIVQDLDRIYFIDYGIMGYLTEKKRFTLLKMFLGISLNSPRIILDSILDLGAISAEVNLAAFERDMQYFLDKYLTMTLKEVKLSILMDDFFDILLKYQIKIDRSLMTLAKTFLTLEGLVERLDRSSSILELSRPMAKKLYKNFLSLEYFKEFGLSSYYDLFILSKSLPKTILDFTRKMEETGYRLKVDTVVDQRLLDLERRREKNRLAGLIFLVASLIFIFSLGFLSLDIIRVEYISLFKGILYLSGGVDMTILVYFIYSILHI